MPRWELEGAYAGGGATIGGILGQVWPPKECPFGESCFVTILGLNIPHEWWSIASLGIGLAAGWSLLHLQHGEGYWVCA